MNRFVLLFLVIASVGFIATFSYLGSNMPPTERHMYALTAKQDRESLYDIYSDASLQPEIRSFAIGQYAFLIEEDVKAREMIERELVYKRDTATSEDLQKIYQFGLSRLNSLLIHKQEKILLNQLVNIIGDEDDIKGLQIPPAEVVDSSPPAVPVDILLTAVKEKQASSPGARLGFIEYEPDFNGLSADEITLQAAAIAKVGVVIKTKLPVEIYSDDCPGIAYQSSVSLYGVDYRNQKIFASHSLSGSITDQKAPSPAPLDATAPDGECIKTANLPDFQGYFQIDP